MASAFFVDRFPKTWDQREYLSLMVQHVEVYPPGGAESDESFRAGYFCLSVYPPAGWRASPDKQKVLCALRASAVKIQLLTGMGKRFFSTYVRF